MRKIGGLLLAVLLLALSIPAALAVAPNGEFTLKVYETNTGRYEDTVVQVVKLTMNGASLSSDMPACLWKGRTMVPVRVIAEKLGADVTWFQDTQEASITLKDRTIRLKIGSAQAQVNGETVTLYDGVPATLVNYENVTRTLVPLRFVSEQLGVQVGWDPETYTAIISTGQINYQVTEIETDAEAGTVHILTSEKPNYVVTDMGDRVVIDLLDAGLDTEVKGTINVDSEQLERVRCAQHDNTLYASSFSTVRVVLDLKEGITYQNNVKLNLQDDGLLVTLTGQGEENPFLFTVPIDPEEKTIVLDAGHGGSDPGAVYGGVNEKDINLAVTKKVEEILSGFGYHVIMTRETDVYVGLYDRADIANEAEADIFVAMHSNAAPTVPSATGAYTYHYISSTKGIQLAQSIQKALCERTGATNRGLMSSQNLVVLRETNMPAVLIEMGFMTNSEELNNLTRPSYQDKLAEGIAEGIICYLNET